MSCVCCERESGSGFDIDKHKNKFLCFVCADAESVIAGGKNILDMEIDPQIIPGASIYMSRLRYILEIYGVVKKLNT
jgi:hypothetical protein